MTESQTSNRSTGFMFFLLLFVVPYIVISLPGVPHWLGRTIAAAIFIFSLSLGAIWYGLSPKSKMILPGGKLNQPQFDSVRPQIERGIRILVVAFAAAYCFYLTVPFTVDLIRLSGGQKPDQIIGTVTDKSVLFLGVWFLEQSVHLSPRGTTYYLLYSWEPIRSGHRYEFFVFSRSQLILDFRDLGS